MFKRLFKKIFGGRNNRILLRMNKIVGVINDMENDVKKLSDKQLAAKTIEFRKCILEGVSVDSLLPKAFAVVREASRRVFNMRHFDVQLLGGIVLNNRCIAEMRTGEGKTLTSTLPAYLNALSCKGVHIVTVNNYLAQRDAENNRPLFEFLGLTVGVILPGQSSFMKKTAYDADITYGTNNEYGFDYLRDNMVFSPKDRVQRKLNYALIDEVDSILIDEARTPLIISGPSDDSSELYRKINQFIPYLIRQDKEDSDLYSGKGHFTVDERSRQVTLTERGLILIEKMMVDAGIMKIGESLYSSSNIILMHHVNAALRAHVLFFREVDYLVKDGEVLIVDEHTGRTMYGRRWSDGLHQAIEAKENLSIQPENQTLASITFQNYFRLYAKLAGMTGTAYTESSEFSSIYKLDTVVIPTNRPMIRKDLPDLVYMTECEKIDAIIKDIKDCIERGQPVLVGTISIEKSEIISSALKKMGIKHNILNAKFHAKEAEIIAQAGKSGAVTIATNMAGRGTDIVLGGNWQSEINGSDINDLKKIAIIKSSWQKNHEAVLSSGGLHVIGTERHESRRIDNQLRGRSGRQGDVGSSRFYLSMEDSLMRIFASERVSVMMRKLGMQQGEAIEHPWVTKTIENAQRRVENRNFDIRKQLLEYDDVSNDQRHVIYSQRNMLLDMPDISNIINDIRNDVIKKLLNKYLCSLSLITTNICFLESCLKDDFGLDLPISRWWHSDNDDSKKFDNMCLRIKFCFIEHFSLKESIVGYKVMRNFEKTVMLQTFDFFWKEHLAAIDYLRQGIHLRGYAQKDPKQEYKRESFLMFETMLENIKYDVISIISKAPLDFLQNIQIFNEKNDVEYNNNCISIFSKKAHLFTKNANLEKMHGHFSTSLSRYSSTEDISNKLCPCKSGKKFNRCHGKL